MSEVSKELVKAGLRFREAIEVGLAAGLTHGDMVMILSMSLGGRALESSNTKKES